MTGRCRTQRVEFTQNSGVYLMYLWLSFRSLMGETQSPEPTAVPITVEITCEEFQEIPAIGALDWEYFTIGDKLFLANANNYDGSTYNLVSKIYIIAE
jgi:hypothetical protein